LITETWLNEGIVNGLLNHSTTLYARIGLMVVAAVHASQKMLWYCAY